MPFGERTPAAPGTLTPFGSAPPAAPQPPTAPPPPMAPGAPAIAPGPKLWVMVNGAPALMEAAQYRSLPPATVAMDESQKSGWQTIAALAPVASTTPAPASAPPAGPVTRGAFGGHQAPPAGTYAAPGSSNQAAAAAAFAGMEAATVTRQGQLLVDGDYIIKITSSEFKVLRSGKGSVIIEALVLVSSHDPNVPAKASCNPEGSNVTIFVNQSDSFKNNMKEIILAVCGFNDQGQCRPETDVVTQAETLAFTSPEQPFAGAICYVEARTKPMVRDATKTFTRIQWWPMPLLPDGKPDTERFFREIR